MVPTNRVAIKLLKDFRAKRINKHDDSTKTNKSDIPKRQPAEICYFDNMDGWNQIAYWNYIQNSPYASQFTKAAFYDDFFASHKITDYDLPFFRWVISF